MNVKKQIIRVQCSLHSILYINQAPVIYIHDLVTAEMGEVMTDT